MAWYLVGAQGWDHAPCYGALSSSKCEWLQKPCLTRGSIEAGCWGVVLASLRRVYCPVHFTQSPRHWGNIVVVGQSLSHVQLFAIPWTVSCQASLSFTISQSLLKLMSIELMMSSNHLVLLPNIMMMHLQRRKPKFREGGLWGVGEHIPLRV